MGTDYAWMNFSKREYFEEERWYRSGKLGAGLAWLMSSFSDFRWKPKDEIELVVTDYDRRYEREIVEQDMYPDEYTDDEKWVDLEDVLKEAAKGLGWITICHHCKKEITQDNSEIDEWLFYPDTDHYYCPNCRYIVNRED